MVTLSVHVKFQVNTLTGFFLLYWLDFMLQKHSIGHMATFQKYSKFQKRGLPLSQCNEELEKLA
jgi:hypothetical protein